MNVRTCVQGPEPRLKKEKSQVVYVACASKSSGSKVEPG